MGIVCSSRVDFHVAAESGQLVERIDSVVTTHIHYNGDRYVRQKHAHQRALPAGFPVIDLNDYGLAASGLSDEDPQSLGRVVGEGRGQFHIITPTGPRIGRVGGALRHRLKGDSRVRPVVGDWVRLQGPSEDEARIIDVLPRRTCIMRKEAGRAQRVQVLASNVDDAWIVCAANEANPRKIERFVAIVAQGGARPHILLNKSDLAQDLQAQLEGLRENFPDMSITPVQARVSPTLQPLMEQLQPGRTFVLLGSSGVGKTTLINALLGEARFLTGATDSEGRGRHTTTGRTLVRLNGGALLVDTPGLREVGIGDAASGIDATFADVAVLTSGCRFADCNHGQDPGCAVTAALQAGTLARSRFDAWQRLHAEGAQPRTRFRHFRKGPS